MWRRATISLVAAVVTAAVPPWSHSASAEAVRKPAVPPAVEPVTPGDPQRTVPEKFEPEKFAKDAPPPTAPAAKETLTDKLGRTDGVLKPPAGIAPPMTVPAPAPHIDREMVVPVPAPTPPPVEPPAPQSPPR